ncbi:MAG TPA: prepilin-type N-terminal cleavage/methylation domain-containing protein [Thermodesulfobacteriota bacterium]|nr:prepilin-type N-terminal cleavage/methylation domain-containing protein [Thermodesulfobacteriota bacterium]
MREPTTRLNKGFTLIEVVVALAILGVGLTVIIELFSGGLRLGRASMEYTRAVNYARVKMEETMAKPTIEEGTQEGESDDKTFRWQMGVKKVDLLSIDKSIDYKPPVELFQVKIDVFWKSGSKEKSTSVESLKAFKPEEDEKKS